ncbi:hypothetical protein HK096_004256, partial [Nowakowskiella sp. JEL0078]
DLIQHDKLESRGDRVMFSSQNSRSNSKCSSPSSFNSDVIFSVSNKSTSDRAKDFLEKNEFKPGTDVEDTLEVEFGFDKCKRKKYIGLSSKSDHMIEKIVNNEQSKSKLISRKTEIGSQTTNPLKSLFRVVTRGSQTLPVESSINKPHASPPGNYKKDTFVQNTNCLRPTSTQNPIHQTNRGHDTKLYPLLHPYASAPFHSDLNYRHHDFRNLVDRPENMVTKKQQPSKCVKVYKKPNQIEIDENQAQNELFSLLKQQIESILALNKEQTVKITSLEHDLTCSSEREIRLQAALDAMKGDTTRSLNDADEKLDKFKRETEIREANLTKEFKHKIRELKLEVYKLQLQEQNSKEDARKAELELQRKMQKTEMKDKHEKQAYLKTLKQELEYVDEIVQRTEKKEKQNEAIKKANQLISERMGITQNHLFNLCERIRNS